MLFSPIKNTLLFSLFCCVSLTMSWSQCAENEMIVTVSITNNEYSNLADFSVINTETGEVVASMTGSYGPEEDIIEDVCLSADACYYVTFDTPPVWAAVDWAVVWNGSTIDSYTSGNAGLGFSYSNDFCFEPGCMDASACNYSPTASEDDGSCDYCVGCTDADACNYDSSFTVDDGSCSYNMEGGFFVPDAMFEGIFGGDWQISVSSFDSDDDYGSGEFFFIDGANESLVDFWISEEALTVDLNGVELVFPITATGVILSPIYPPVTTFGGIEQCEYEGCDDELACNYLNEEEEPCSYFEEAEDIDMAEEIWLTPAANPNEEPCDVLHYFELIELPSGRFGIDMDYDQENFFLGPLSAFFPDGLLADMQLSICGEFLSVDQGLFGSHLNIPLVDGEYFDLSDILISGIKLYVSPGASVQTEACLDANACNYDAEACGLLDFENCIYPDDGLCPGDEVVAGCMDELACNYNAEANQSDDSCIYFSNENFEMDEVFYHSPTLNAAPFSSSTGSCASIAYDPNEAVPLELYGDDADEPLYWQFSDELEDLLDDGAGSSWLQIFNFSGEEVASDLTNLPLALCENSIKMAVEEEGVFSAVLPLISPGESSNVYSGDWLGDHYSAAIGTFIPESLAQEGCIDPDACEYNPCAVPTEEEGLCTYPEEENQGCEVCDEGSVDLLITYDGLDGFPEEFSFEVENAAGELILDGAGAGEFEACIAPEECISITLYDEYGDGTSGFTSCGTITVFMDGQELGGASCNWGFETTLEFCHSTGCLDVQACNYGEEDADCVYAEENLGCEVCDGETVDLLISYDGLDGYPEEFSFTVEDSEGVLLLDGAGAGDFEACIAADACITITMFDEYGDGMDGWPSCGTVTIFMDGEEVGDASCNWGSETSFVLGACSGGCFDDEACNYGDLEAEECVYPEENLGCEVCEGESLDLLIVYDGADGFPEEFSFVVETMEGDLILDGAGAGQFEACVPADACFTVTLYDEWGDGTDGYPDCGEILIFFDGEEVGAAACDWGSETSFMLGSCGCLEEEACNYLDFDADDCIFPEEFGCEVCDDESLDLLITYDGADGYPDEFSFEVVTLEGELILDGAGAGLFEACVPPDECFIVTLYDEGGDGSAGLGDCGEILIFFDGQEVGAAACDWGFETSFALGSCGNCLEEEACNYLDPDAEDCIFPDEYGCEFCDDESLDLLITYDGADGYPEEFSFTATNGAGEIILEGAGAGLFEACVSPDECITITLYDDYGDGTDGFPNCGDVRIYLDGEGVANASCDWGSEISFNLGQCVGCLDPAACNYDATANVSGLCLYYDVCGECGGPGLPDAFALDAVLHMDEDEMGDFSSDASNPTPVPFAGEGAYILSGSAANFQTPNADPEYFSITIPAGYQISGIRMLEFDQVGYEAAGEPAGNGGFFGIGATAELPIIYGPADFPAAANALDAGALVGVLPGSGEGFGILDELMMPFVFPDFGINIPGLSEAPGAGTYTFMWKEGNAHPDAFNAYINWSFALEISAAGADHYTMLVDCEGCLNDADDDGVCDELEIAGCTDAASCNYDPAATDDDGSCDDMPAAAAYCMDGTIWSEELCGCAPPSCLTDLDFDGETGTTDLLIMLSGFGLSCE